MSVLGIAIALTLAACQPSASSAPTASSVVVVPSCAPVATPGPVEMPPDFPSDFPLPPGMVITAARVTTAGGAEVQGYAPGELTEVAQWFTEALPAAGFTNGVGDSESGEAEADFSGPGGLVGHWLILIIADCPGALGVLIGTYRPPE